MSDKNINSKTTLQGEDVIVKAVQFFSTAKFRATSQSGRVVTFQGMPPIPWFMLLLTVLGFLFCVIPGIIMYVLVIRKLRRFQNLVVSTGPITGGTEVTITYPDWANDLVQAFLRTLPPAPVPAN